MPTGLALGNRRSYLDLAGDTVTVGAVAINQGGVPPGDSPTQRRFGFWNSAEQAAAGPISDVGLASAALDETHTARGPPSMVHPMAGNGAKTTTRRIHEVKPREQVGARTGILYEFQYHIAAEHSLQVLEDAGPRCILCEWHDDFVAETDGPRCTLYAFRQVKSRSLSEGPWKLRSMLGLGRKKNVVEAALADSIGARLFEHQLTFGDACAEVVLLTNSAGEADLQQFLNEVKAASSPRGLSGNSLKTFKEMAEAYELAFSANAKQCFAFLKKLRIVGECGSPGDLRTILFRLAPRLFELSEIDLKTTEAQRIGRELVELVRQKSQVVVDLPTTDADLKAQKGILAKDVLPLLSLSHDGFAELRKGTEKGTLRSLSRLHRMCRASGIPDAIIPDVCRFKALWDAWLYRRRPDIPELELASLKKRCLDLLSAHTQGAMDWNVLGKTAKELAVQFGKNLGVDEELTGELVMGYFFSLASAADSTGVSP